MIEHNDGFCIIRITLRVRDIKDTRVSVSLRRDGRCTQVVHAIPPPLSLSEKVVLIDLMRKKINVIIEL